MEGVLLLFFREYNRGLRILVIFFQEDEYEVVEIVWLNFKIEWFVYYMTRTILWEQDDAKGNIETLQKKKKKHKHKLNWNNL